MLLGLSENLVYQKATGLKVYTNGKAQITRSDASQQTPNDLIAEAWNKAVDEIKDLSDYSPTVWNFLDTYESDYPDLDYTGICKINQIGI